MSATKKITIHVSEDLMKRAQIATGQGITDTIRRGLQLVATSDSYEKLRKLRGKIKFSLTTAEMKKDRT